MLHDHDINHRFDSACGCDLCVTVRAEMDTFADTRRDAAIEHMEAARPVCLFCVAPVAELGDVCRECARRTDDAADTSHPWHRSWTPRRAVGRTLRGRRS